MRLLRCLRGLAAFTVAACGGASSPSAVSPSDPAPSAASPPITAATATGKSTPTDDPPGPDLPVTCANAGAPFCTPPSDFVERLCAKPHQGAALALFAQSTPFTRVYVRGRVDELRTDEEVLVLHFHPPQKNGIVVGSNNGSYDLLRWDGSCSMAIESEAITRTRPPRPATAHIQWHRISGRVQDALVAASEPVKRAHARRGKECKGAMSGDVSAACEKADRDLVGAVADYVRSGGAMPAPDDVP